MRDDARPYGRVIFQLIGIANYLQKGPDRIALRGWGEVLRACGSDLRRVMVASSVLDVVRYNLYVTPAG